MSRRRQLEHEVSLAQERIKKAKSEDLRRKGVDLRLDNLQFTIGITLSDSTEAGF